MMHRICRSVWIGITAVLMLLGFSGAATAQQKWAACKPIETASFANRVHVRCEQPVDGKFTFFSVSTADPRLAARALSVFEAGQLGDKYVNVLFDPADQSGVAFGCLAHDCRAFTGVALRESLPGACEINSVQPSCPGFCNAQPNAPGCPRYCGRNDDINCRGFCTRHPNDPECQPDKCGANRRLAGCEP